jgi:phospholipid/cholesterol/gamma-HCH transport system substrate-binding protein
VRRRGKKKGSGLSPVVLGLIVLVLAVVITYFGFTKKIPFRHQFTVKAAFANAVSVAKGSPVRIAGVNVGKVSGLSHEPGNPTAALVTMQIQNQGLPIHKDATLEVRPRTFLEGNFFVQVDPGSPSAPLLKDGDTIPVNQTGAPVQLDQVLDVLKSSTRQDLQHLLAGLSTGLSGRGAASFNQSIPEQGPAFRANSIVNNALLGQDQHDLSNYIKSAGAVAMATDADPNALKGLVSDFDTFAGALAAKDTQLAAAIHDLPATLTVGRPSLAAVNAALPNVNAFAKAFDPGVRSSLPAINASIPLVQQLRLLVRPQELQGLVHDLRPTVPALVRLNQASVPLLSQTRAASSCQNTVILPWSHKTLTDNNFPATGQVYQEAVKFLPGISGESRSGDANGQWFRVLLVAPQFAAPTGTGNLLLSPFQIQGFNPPHPVARPDLRPDVPCETQQPPNLDTTAAGPPAGQQPIFATPTLANQRLEAAANTDMVDLARQMVKSAGMQNTLRVSDRPVSAADIPHLRAK